MRILLVLGFLFPIAVATSHAQPKPDPEAQAIRQAALDYIEGWYEGNVERMTRAVHPELVKRIVATENGASRIDNMGASRLISGVRAGGGKKTPKDKQQKDVTILDRYENVGQVVVTDRDGSLLGMVSAVDLVRYFVSNDE